MLQLSLDFNQTEYAAGDPIQATLTLLNSGPAAERVNARLALNVPFALPRYREVSLAVTGPAGEALPFMAKVNVGAAQDKHFKLLAPGESAQHTYSLRDYYQIKAPGAYTVTATYENQAEPTPAESTPAEDSRRAWKGELKSGPASFTVV